MSSLSVEMSSRLATSLEAGANAFLPAMCPVDGPSPIMTPDRQAVLMPRPELLLAWMEAGVAQEVARTVLRAWPPGVRALSLTVSPGAFLDVKLLTYRSRPAGGLSQERRARPWSEPNQPCERAVLDEIDRLYAIIGHPPAQSPWRLFSETIPRFQEGWREFQDLVCPPELASIVQQWQLEDTLAPPSASPSRARL